MEVYTVTYLISKLCWKPPRKLIFLKPLFTSSLMVGTPRQPVQVRSTGDAWFHVIMFYSLFLVKYLKQLTSHMSSLQYGTLSTLMGRYYAMDRDKRYDRIKIAFEGMVEGKGEEATIGDLAEVRE